MLCFSLLSILGFLCLIGDAVRLYRERGFKQNTFFYHLGDGGHAYHFNTETASSIYFKCALYERYKCHGRAILKLGGRFFHSNPHNHPPDPDFVGERHFRQNVLDQCRRGDPLSFQEILNQARRDRKYSRRVRSRMTLRRLSGSMYAARKASFPDIPHTLPELTHVLLQNQYRHISNTVDGMDNMYAGSVTALDGSHHVAFFSERMLRFMGRLKVIQGDGTFRARPATPYSCQCFVLVTTWRNCIIPLGWVLMERRTIAAYRAVFELIKRLCPNLNPDVIISDWEYPQQKAWSEAFPNADIQGCLWHLCRAFVRKANKLNLLRYKNVLPDVLKLIRRATALCLLPDNFMEDGLAQIRQASLDADVLVWFLLRPFLNYVQDKWLHNHQRRRWMSLFRVAHRTNNACESHNRILRKAVGAYRPNVFLFIHALSRLEHNATLDIDLLTVGGHPKRARKVTSVYADEHLNALANDLEMDIFQDQEVAISNFLTQACNIYHGAFDDFVNHPGGRADDEH